MMAQTRKPVAALAAAAALAIGAGAAHAATTPTATGAGSFVDGGGTVTFSFDASGLGPSATGSMTIEDHGTLSGHIACLAVHGDEAMVQAQIDSSPLDPGHAGSVGNYIYLDVTDSPDGDAAFVSYGGGTASNCFPFNAPSYPLTSGGVTLTGGDVTPPDISAAVTGPLGNAGWYTGDVHVGWTLLEPESWMWAEQGCGDTDVTTDGLTTLTCSAQSAGGRGSKTVQILRDATPPTISGAADRAPNANGWYTSDVVVGFTCRDALSGVAACTKPVTLGEGTNQSVSGTATDRAGNSANAAVGGLNVDETAPTITGAADRAPNANGWYSSDVVVGFTCADALSGVATCTTPVTVGEGASQSASGGATDRAGNHATASVGGLNVDETAPLVSYTGNRGSYTIADDVAITCSATDALSGVAGGACSGISGPAWTFGLGTTTRSATATDLAGNIGSASATFTVTADASSLVALIGDQLPAGLANSLAAKLKSGNVKAFDNEVDAQTGKSIDPALAALLKKAAAGL